MSKHRFNLRSGISDVRLLIPLVLVWLVLVGRLACMYRILYYEIKAWKRVIKLTVLQNTAKHHHEHSNNLERPNR